jgi:DNA-binding MarR family transcriptional regulator
VYDRTLAPCGLRVTQYSLLSHLATQRAWTLAALAEAMDMERTTLLRNLRPLVSSGWVRVQARPNTRKQEVTLTPSGRAKRAQARSLWRIAQNAVAATLGPAEVQRLHRRVDRYLARLRHPQPEA